MVKAGAQVLPSYPVKFGEVNFGGWLVPIISPEHSNLYNPELLRGFVLPRTRKGCGV